MCEGYNRVIPPCLSGIETWPEKLVYMLCCLLVLIWLTYKTKLFICSKQNFLILEILTYQFQEFKIFNFFSHIFGMENDIRMIFISKWFLISVEYIDSKFTIWPMTTSASFTCVGSHFVDCYLQKIARIKSFWVLEYNLRRSRNKNVLEGSR